MPGEQGEGHSGSSPSTVPFPARPNVVAENTGSGSLWSIQSQRNRNASTMAKIQKPLEMETGKTIQMHGLRTPEILGVM